MKKKFSVVFLVALMIASLFISCDNGIKNSDPLAKVLFVDSESLTRGLNSSSLSFDVDQYYWTYEAQKMDNSGLKTGETTVPVAVSKKGVQGLAESVGPFSLGTWKFTLQAHEDSTSGNVLYTGVASNVVITDNPEGNKVSIKVHPLQEGNGTVVISDAITLKDAKGNLIANYDEVITFAMASTPDKPAENLPCLNRAYTVPAGAWKVNIAYVSKDDPSIVYGSNSIYVTVFANQTVTIGGSLEEITADTKFETTVDGGTKAISAPVAVTVATPSKLEVKSSPSSAQSETEKTTVDIPANALKAEGDAKLSVTSYDSPVASKVFTVADGNGAAIAALDINLTVNDQAVIDFNDQEVTVSTYIAKGLGTKPTVVYNGGGADMQPNQDNVTYDSESGLLTFKTNHFSQYYIVADVVAMNATTQEYYYTTESVTTNDGTIEESGLKAAFDFANPGDTIVLLKDVDLGADNNNCIKVSTNVVFDMNGKTLKSASAWYVFKIFNGGSLTIDNGTIILQSSGASDMFYINEGGLVVNGGNYKMLAHPSPVEKQMSCITSYDKGNVTVNGGTFDCLDSWYFIATNGSKGLTNEIVVNDCDAAGKIYFPSAGSLTINGGKFTNNATVLNFKGDKLNINGGSFNVTGSEDKFWSHNGNGAYYTGDALIIESCNYPSGTPTINIRGGLFKGYNDDGSIPGEWFTHGITCISHDGYEMKPSPVIEPEAGTTIGNYSVKGKGKFGFLENGVVALSWAENANDKWAEDYATANTFTIKTPADAAQFAYLVNSGKDFKGKTVNLNNDLDLNNVEWVPIGSTRRFNNKTDVQPLDYRGTNVFRGTFNGQNHSINNLKINQSPGDKSAVGFFGIVGEGAVIQNLKIASGSVINNNDAAAGVVGMTVGNVTIKNCENSAVIGTDIQGNQAWGSSSGGIVARIYAVQDPSLWKIWFGEDKPYNDKNSTVSITGCKNFGAISGKSKSGGIAGFVDDSLVKTSITNCENSGNITDVKNAGGIIAWVQSDLDITGSTNAGAIVGPKNNINSDSSWSGLIGYNHPTIKHTVTPAESTVTPIV